MDTLEDLSARLLDLHETLRSAVLSARDRDPGAQQRVAATTPADTLYGADVGADAVVERWFERSWPSEIPVELIAEGCRPTTFPRGTATRDTRFKCIVDPIDGTRAFVHDKRSAWILTGIAPQRGSDTTLDDLVVARMSELPVVKQRRADEFSAVRGGGARGWRVDLDTGARESLAVEPSDADSFEHGFASIARFFPRDKALSARFEHALWERLGLADGAIFEDQYLATAGQLHELMTGRDRMLADLRPLLHASLGVEAPVCHPYDVCTALIAQEAGCVIEDVRGGPLRAPLDTTSPVAWIGFANRALAARVRPELDALLDEFFGAP